MSTRVTTTILLILLVLVSAASGVYHHKSRQEIEALQQRITDLTRDQSQPGTQPPESLTNPGHPATRTPPSQSVTTSEADTSGNRGD